MRVLVLTHNYPRFSGDAAGAFIARLAQGTAGAGYQVQVVAPHAPGLPERSVEDGVTIRRFRYAPEFLEVIAYRGDLHYRAVRSPVTALVLPFFLMSFQRAARQAVREFQPDVVHAHWWAPAGRVAQRLDRPYVLTSHGTDVRLLEQSRLLRRSGERVYRRARAVTAVSTFLTADIRRLLPEVSEVAHTPMPLDIAFFERGRVVPKAVPA
ncbi:MAG: glycosyltransferase, partial [Gemmatimonadetes bacterium]|nr:glycosyltransferase [Gemmatimonadota bacterium]